jgi:hypothetical protein
MLEEVCYQVRIEQVIEDYKYKICICYYKLPLDVDYPCSVTCRAVLTYRYNCIYTCKDYNTRIKNMIIKKIYRVCNTWYRRLYITYSYSCKALCYSNILYLLCTESCKVSYNYSKYSKLYYKPYILYIEDCT